MKIKGLLLLLFILIVLLIGGFIGAQNSHMVQVNYLISDPSAQAKMSYILAISFGCGFLFCFILYTVYAIRLKLRLALAERKLQNLTPSK